MINILWHRRDLRIEDNICWHLASQAPHPIQPIFIFDKAEETKVKSLSCKRINFVLDSLIQLNKKLKKNGSQVIILIGNSNEIIPKLSNILNSTDIFVGADFDPDTLKNDKAIAQKVNLTVINDHLLLPPERILKEDGTPYKVFTPYLKKWLTTLEPLDFAEYKISDSCKFANSEKIKEILLENNFNIFELPNDANNPHFRADKVETIFENFIQHKLGQYDSNRDFLTEEANSKLSPFIRYGNISIRRCYREAIKLNLSRQWIFELAWRDFYAMILYYHPESIELELQPIYRKLKWDNNPLLLQKFVEAKTGIPIIDAAIRQLIQTGWMHNRARMIVASFMTKNLWLDWRLGEKFFAEHLIDYDISANVGGWQWSASTGTDAQPYFRIFNPWLQSQKYDPEGKYIRKFLPELASLPDREIHKPSPLFISQKYWHPIVDYEESRKRAIWNFKNV